MSFIRQSFHQQEYSEDLMDILMKSWSSATKKQYSTHLLRWIEYCRINHVDPFSASVKQGAEFLFFCFKSTDNGYSALNTARSALSSIILPTNGVTFGKHPLIQRLLRGIFKERPSLPKYTVTYDVKRVFNFITSLDQDSLSLELVSKCLATLLCLISSQRSQTIASLSIDHMYIDESNAIFYIPSLLKQSRPGFHQKPLEFVSYPQDRKLCPVTMIKTYLGLTKNVRSREKYSKFFLSYGQPYRPVGSTTIARWVTDILSKSGIDTTTFTAHSTRSASTSKAKQNLSLSEIAQAAGWAGSQTFARHYNKPIVENYGLAIMK